MGGAEADPVAEMLVLEAIAYHDFTSSWCTMVGATAVGSLGAFLPQAGLDRVFANRHIPVTLVHEGAYRANFYVGLRNLSVHNLTFVEF